MDLQIVVHITLALVFGLLVGSFLNVVIYRLPVQLMNGWRRDAREFLELAPESSEDASAEKPFNVAFPASHCPKCNGSIKAWQNIPIISYLLLGGKCQHCKAKISLQYPLVELITGLATAFIVYRYGLTPTAGLLLIFTWCLIALTGIDFNEQLLPDNITLPLLWLGLLSNYFNTLTSLENAVLGAVIGYLSLWSVFWLFKLVTGKEGMGHGDFKLLAALGAWLGWQQIPMIILLSSVVGAVVGITLILAMGRDKQVPIPFGPYLAAAGWIALMWGDTISQYYSSLFSFS